MFFADFDYMGLGTLIASICTGAAVIVAAVANAILQVRNGAKVDVNTAITEANGARATMAADKAAEKVAEVHGIVNSQREIMMAKIEALSAEVRQLKGGGS